VFIKKCIIFIFLSLAIFAHIVCAQDEDTTFRAKADTKLKNTDKIYYVDKPDDTTIHTPNPTRVLFESMFFPGAGQFDNKGYIKGTVVFSLEVALIGAVKHYTDKATGARRNFERARAARDGVVSTGTMTVPYGSVSVSDAEFARLFNDYQNARDEQNRFRWYLGAFIFLSMFDAFVDAHLAQFPKAEDNLSFDVESDRKDMVSVKLSYYLW
jgi:hypothetical protein